jgi:hypothetical protein
MSGKPRKHPLVYPNGRMPKVGYYGNDPEPERYDPEQIEYERQKRADEFLAALLPAKPVGTTLGQLESNPSVLASTQTDEPSGLEST